MISVGKWRAQSLADTRQHQQTGKVIETRSLIFCVASLPSLAWQHRCQRLFFARHQGDCDWVYRLNCAADGVESESEAWDKSLTEVWLMGSVAAWPSTRL